MTRLRASLRLVLLDVEIVRRYGFAILCSHTHTCSRKLAGCSSDDQPPEVCGGGTDDMSASKHSIKLWTLHMFVSGLPHFMQDCQNFGDPFSILARFRLEESHLTSVCGTTCLAMLNS